MFQTFMHDEAALLRAARAEWALVPLSYSARGTEPTEEPAVLVDEAGVTVGRDAENQIVCDSPTVRCVLASSQPRTSPLYHVCQLLATVNRQHSSCCCLYVNARLPHRGSSERATLRCVQTSAQHACVTKRDGDHFVEDLGSEAGTWLNDRRLQAKVPKLLRPGKSSLLRLHSVQSAEHALLQSATPQYSLREMRKVSQLAQTAGHVIALVV